MTSDGSPLVGSVNAAQEPRGTSVAGPIADPGGVVPPASRGVVLVVVAERPVDRVTGGRVAPGVDGAALPSTRPIPAAAPAALMPAMAAPRAAALLRTSWRRVSSPSTDGGDEFWCRNGHGPGLHGAPRLAAQRPAS